MTETQGQSLSLNAAKAAVLVSCLLVAAKAWVWLESGSAALLASLMDSGLDALVSLTNLLVITYALRPADDDHRYGHGKAEGIAALAQAAFITGSCVFVVLEALRLFSNPAPIAAVKEGVIVLVIGTVVTLALTRYQARAVKKSGSLAIEADAAHYTGDMLINLGVIASLVAGSYFDILWLDPLVALIVAGWLVFTARKIAIKAVNMLLDRELEDDVRNDVMVLIRTTPGVEDMHDLRTRSTGPRMLMSFDIEVDPNLTLIAAHEISRAVEARIIAKYPRAEVMIHIDPRGDITDSRHKKLKDFHAR